VRCRAYHVAYCVLAARHICVVAYGVRARHYRRVHRVHLQRRARFGYALDIGCDFCGSMHYKVPVLLGLDVDVVVVVVIENIIYLFIIYFYLYNR
jgi:hypothetical protein